MENLRNLSNAKFEKLIETLCHYKSLDDNSLMEEVDRYYGEIVSKLYVFNRMDLEVGSVFF